MQRLAILLPGLPKVLILKQWFGLAFGQQFCISHISRVAAKLLILNGLYPEFIGFGSIKR